MKRWELFNLDVWGNSLEGFEVNDSTLLAILDLPRDGEEITDDMPSAEGDDHEADGQAGRHLLRGGWRLGILACRP